MDVKTKPLTITDIGFILLASSHPFNYQEFIKTQSRYPSVHIFMDSTDIFTSISFSITNQITKQNIYEGKSREKKTRKMYLPPDFGNHCLSMTYSISLNIHSSVVSGRIHEAFTKALNWFILF